MTGDHEEELFILHGEGVLGIGFQPEDADRATAIFEGHVEGGGGGTVGAMSQAHGSSAVKDACAQPGFEG